MISQGIFILLWILGGMVTVGMKTENYLVKVKRLELRQPNKESSSTIKIKLVDNFVERLNPLRCVDFTVNLMVQVLLISRVK